MIAIIHHRRCVLWPASPGRCRRVAADQALPARRSDTLAPRRTPDPSQPRLTRRVVGLYMSTCHRAPPRADHKTDPGTDA